ncbi:MAG TPA: hypothetical protein VK923_00590 [Euzebyales bacterium]|nr:hypothetical protein [Euzebyales bacterium]
MAGQAQYSPAPGGEASSTWASGIISFASILMILTGSLQALAGLIAIFGDDLYVATENYLFQFDTTTWGWIHLLIGLVVLLAGFGILFGQTWARAVGITLALISSIAFFLFLPYYPFWSLLIIALNVLIIWALAAHGGATKRTGY